MVVVRHSFSKVLTLIPQKVSKIIFVFINNQNIVHCLAFWERTLERTLDSEFEQQKCLQHTMVSKHSHLCHILI